MLRIRLRIRRAVSSASEGIAAAAALVVLVTATPPLVAQPPNVLLILVDDVGIEHLAFYGLKQDPDVSYPETPTLTSLVEGNEVVLFTNAWSTPVCSSTRMWIQTGLYGLATGAGSLINPEDEWQPDLGANYFLADLLKADPSNHYMTAAAFGKWHIGDDDDDAPDQIGYNHYRVTYHKDFYGGTPSYFAFKYTMNVPNDDPVKVEVATSEGKYLTRETANWVIDWLNSPPTEPWFAYVAFFASHHPWHCPPDALYEGVEGCDEQVADNVDLHHFMIHALDHEIGRILAEVDLEETLVIIAGDNGSQGGVAVAPVLSGKAKGTVAQGGVRVPMLMTGAGIDPDLLGQDFTDIVSLTDLYDTILDFGEAAGPGDRSAAENKHSVSLKPYLDNDLTVPGTPARACAYTEIFTPNGEMGGPLPPPNGEYSLYDIAVRDDQYKYLRKYASGQQLLFRLEGVDPDPWETENLLTDPGPTELAAMFALLECGDEFFGECRLHKQNGEMCTYDEECCSGECDEVEDECVAE